MGIRTLAAIVLSLIVVLVYQYYFVKPLPPRSAENEISHEQDSKETLEETLTETMPLRQKAIAGKDIKVEGDLYTAIFTTAGGTLKSFKLKNYRETLDRNSEPVELVNIPDDMGYPFAVTFPDSSISITHEGIYEADKEAINLVKTENPQKLIFTQSYPEKIKIEKIFTFYPEKYLLDLEVCVYNLSQRTLSEKILLSWNQFVDPESKTSRYTHEGPIYFVKNSVSREDVKKLDARKFIGPDVSWAGFEDKYFLASMIPQKPSLTSLVLSRDSEKMASVALEGPKILIPPGQSGSFNYSLYMGPKDYSILSAEGVGLENSIDFGDWIKWLALPLLVALKFLHQYVHNYGIAIILLTIFIKIAFWPLGNKSYKSMKKMQELQPMMLKIREKYKDDKAKLNQETMDLYKKHKVNPLGGCLPMLVQIPVFFGLYKTLLYSIELRHSPFFWWIQDLSAKDPYYVTPIIMGATMFLQQKMTPQMGDSTQQKMMLWMPVIFTFLFLNFPSGLVIYWLFNNILSIGQQYYINKQTS